MLVALCRFCRQNVNFSLNIMWDKSQSVVDIIKSDFGGDAMKTLSYTEKYENNKEQFEDFFGGDAKLY